MPPFAPHEPALVTFLLYGAYAGGGVTRVTVNLANHLARTRRVRVISLYRRREHAAFDLSDDVELVQLRDMRQRWRRYHPLDRLPSRLQPRPTERGTTYATDLHLRRAIRDVHEGVIVSTRPSLHLALATYARPEVATVGWDHLNFEAREQNQRQMEVLRAAIPQLDAYVALTDADAADYRRVLPECSTKIEVVRNCVSWPVARALPDEREKVVVAAGRLVKRKGFDRLIRLFAPVAAAHPDWRLHIYGRGPEQDALAAQIERLGLGGQVELRGYANDLRRVMRRASVYAMSSYSEGFPLVLLEAMSVGLPLISFDCPRGPGELINHGRNGLLIPNGRGRAYTRGLLRLVNDGELRGRLGAAGLADAQRYTVDAIAARWEGLFDELVSSRRVPDLAGRRP